jgi:hypothetical protein
MKCSWLYPIRGFFYPLDTWGKMYGLYLNCEFEVLKNWSQYINNFGVLCMCGIFNVCVFWQLCGCFVIYVIVFTVFLFCFIYVYLLLFVTSVRTTATELISIAINNDDSNNKWKFFIDSCKGPSGLKLINLQL